MKIGVIGDMHMKEFLSYADYISDQRVSEKQNILNFIIESFKDCSDVVFMGDNFNSKNNSSETNAEFVRFLEKFGKKELHIISGNHEKRGDGKTAIDFLREIKKTNWHVYTNHSRNWIPPVVISEVKNGTAEVSKQIVMDFLPYMLNTELGAETSEEATKKIMEGLEQGHILFAHHMISGTTFLGQKTDDFPEIVLPREELKKRFKLVVAGHIHAPQMEDRVLITGNLFTTFVGETEKFIYRIDDDFQVEKLKVPCRAIHKFENQIGVAPYDSIIKMVVTDKNVDIEKLKEELEKFDAHLLVQDYPNERKKMKIEDGAMDFSIEALLKLYSQEKGVDLQKLLAGLELIK